MSDAAASQGLLPSPSFNIYLAYDGSINSDWVARYAINMAVNNQSRRINLVHIQDGVYPLETLTEKISYIEAESAVRGVEFYWSTVKLAGTVYDALLETVPPGRESLCICGARSTSRSKGYLAGTISEKLLRCRRFNVFAIRVVKPGILGLPRDILFPLSGHPHGLQAVTAFLLLMVPQAKRLYLLRVMNVKTLLFRYMSAARAHSIRQAGRAYLDEILKDLRLSLEAFDLFLDGKVVVSDDWVKEILIHANRYKAQMIIMGASDRNMPSRYFYGNKIEQVLRQSPCDVAIYRKI